MAVGSTPIALASRSAEPVLPSPSPAKLEPWNADCSRHAKSGVSASASRSAVVNHTTAQGSGPCSRNVSAKVGIYESVVAWDEFTRMEEGFSPTKQSVKARYTLGDVVGEGSCCEVCVAHDRRTGQSFACKIVPVAAEDETRGQTVPDWMATGEETRHEAELARRLRSPHIVSCREYFEEDGNIYLIMDLMRGGDMQDELLRLGNFTEVEARRAFAPIIHGLMHLHSQGVAHRDLNLENILLESPHDLQTARLSDFGMARRSTPLDPFRTMCGSAHYIAPEVLSESGVYDARCDMWSAGVCLFAMLSGYLPFDNESLPQLLDQIKRGEIDFSDSCWGLISQNARDLVTKLLCVDPDKRLSAEQVLNHQWMRSSIL